MVDKKRIFIFIAFFIFLVFIQVSIVFADRVIIADTGAALNNTLCRNNYSIQYVLILNNIIYNESLNQSILLLENEYIRLSENIDDRDMFRYYLLNNYNPSYFLLKISIKEWKKQNLNLTNQQKIDIQKNISVIGKQYDECNYKSFREYANSRLESYKKVVNYYQKQVNEMNESGVDVRKLNNILVGSRKLINNFENELNRSKSSDRIIKILDKYCLNDGCLNGTNYHFSSKVSLEKLELSLDLIKDEKDISDEKTLELEEYIQTVRDSMYSSGDKKFNSMQKKIIWDNIKKSNNLVKEIKNIILNNRKIKK